MHDWTPHRVVDALTGRIEPLETEFARAYWESQIDATPPKERKRAQLELELRRAKGDPEALAAVRQALESDIYEPLLRRQLEVLRLSLTGNQMDEGLRVRLVDLSSQIESEFASYRPTLNGRAMSDNDIEAILKSSDDQELRRRAWEGSKEIGARVAELVRELARLRNAAARDLGFADYYRMALALQELDERWLFGLLDDLERLTAQPYAAWKADLDARLLARWGSSAVYPWHYADPFFQQLPPEARVGLDGLLSDRHAAELARATFAGLGIDLAGVLKASDLYPRDKKSQHAFCIDIDRSTKDVRILANIVPGERWCEIMLHESGHAAYDVSFDPRLPYVLRRAAHTFVTEAVAIMAGRLVRDPVWLTEVAGLPAIEVGAIEQRLRASEGAQSLQFARWALVVIHFERALYSDPETDLDARWWQLVERFQMITPPERRNPDWAAKIHIAAAPVYYHNYLLGELLASQLRATIDAECGSLVGRNDAGELLRERLFKKGASRRWDDTVRHATGRPLESGDFVASAVS